MLIHTQNGETALHIAAQYGFEDIASLLIAYGAPVMVRSAARQTARELALRGGFIEIVEMLDGAAGVLSTEL